jgi:predicted phosphoribosyltransferase
VRYEPFADRAEAGKLLGAEVVRRVGKRQDLVVLALPRGGVPVGYQVARALDAPLDVFIVRKLGVPGQEELAMGAIASGGVRVLNDEVLRYVPVPTSTIERVAEFEARELERRERAYRRDRPPLDVTGKTVVIVDDGFATGSTMRAAVEALQKMKPKEIVVAVPVAAPSTCAEFQSIVDEMICLRTPEPFQSVGLWYRDFRQTTDEEVQELLALRTNTTPGIPR